MPQIIRKRIPYVGNIYDSQPVGEIIQCERETPPAGYIELGETRKSVLRSKYPELFKQIGTTYGAEDDEHFNLPSISEVNNYTNAEIDTKLSEKAVGNGKIYYTWFTPRQMSDISHMASVIASYPIGSIILFSVGWDEYEQFYNFAGRSGYIIITSGSTYAFGQTKGYGDNNWSHYIKCTDNPGNCSGWLSY